MAEQTEQLREEHSFATRGLRFQATKHVVAFYVLGREKAREHRAEDEEYGGRRIGTMSAAAQSPKRSCGGV